MVNQKTPFGTLQYNQTGTNADGVPQFTSVQSLTPKEQQLFNTTLDTQQGIGTSAQKLIGNLGDTLTTPPNLDPSKLTTDVMGWGQKYLQPVFNQQQSNLDSKLASQGITQGSQAWDNAQNLQSRNVNDAYTNLLMQAEPTAYQQAVSSYELPISTLGTLLGQSQPGNVASSLTSTPSASVQPANYAGLAEQNYAQENAQYGNLMSGLFSIPSAVLGGWARSSDARVKEDIVRVGTLDNGLPVYVYRYKRGDTRPQIGLMAQDVIKTKPWAVSTMSDGYLGVDYVEAVQPNGR